MKFVKLLFVFISVALVVSCSNLKAPEYVGVGKVNVSKIINDSITIKAGLKFNNPNRMGGKIALSDLHAVVNDIDLGKLKNQEVKVPSRKDFEVPLEIKLSYGQIFDSKKGLLNSILSSILTNEVAVKFTGKATFKKFLVKKEYPIQFNDKIKILK
ncbi:hypothetical protein [Wenyingzhuangia marina]|uniref:Late embryogenesis abundant protein n=1 Tax=Wenyingzhuangia marina TaxID=1195760 RepID=A0A1M5V9A3_9FLAO|nr:hypothetical protein [Wenyingzhuangia marina]GGF73546.1 hypothetical protein GCM10011397_15600 [Wenyingzhuangia marina]SHH71805.1 Late embryogenesis abundant protein [Wenyingzhuangia marina]